MILFSKNTTEQAAQLKKKNQQKMKQLQDGTYNDKDGSTGTSTNDDDDGYQNHE